jgi:uncharacterized membrane protein
MKLPERAILAAVWWFHLFGALWFLLGMFQAWAPICAQAAVVLLGLFALLLWYREGGRAACLVWGAVVVVGGFLLEVLGTATGIPFGSYRYGEALGPGRWEVPFAMGFAWLLTMAGARGVGYAASASAPARVLVGAVAVVLLDVALERAAPRLDYWHWETGSPPFANFAAWGGATVVFSTLAERFVPRPAGGFFVRFSVHALAAQAVYFVVTGWG